MNRGCPWMTACDRWLGHGGGTAGARPVRTTELEAWRPRSPARRRVRPVHDEHLPRWQVAAGGAAGQPRRAAVRRNLVHVSRGCLPRADRSGQEPRQGLHQPLRIVEPGIVAAARLHGQLGLTEQAGVPGGALGGEGDVVLARDEQDRCPKAGEGGSGGFRVEGAGRVVDGRRIRIRLARLPGEVGLGNGVPSAVGEGCDRRPVSGRGVADQIRSSAAKASGNQASPRRNSATCRRSRSVISRVAASSGRRGRQRSPTRPPATAPDA